MTRVKAGVLTLILAGHAGIYFWHWYLPQTVPVVAAAPLSVSVALVPPKPTANAVPSTRSKDRAQGTRAEVGLPTPSEDSKAIAQAAPDASPAPVAPLQLDLPQQSRTVATMESPVRMALEDPRSNTAKPRQSERFAIALGSYECVVTERMPDGSIYRGPGVWDAAPNSDVTATGGILDPRGPSRVCRRKPL